MGMCTTDENYIEEKQIPVYSFEKVDMSKYLTQDDAEIMAYEFGYDTNFEYETPLTQYDITIDEFFANKGLLFIHCDEEWKAKILTRVFDGKGEKWGDGNSYLDTTKYNAYRKKSCYSNYGGIANVSDLHTNAIYPFDKVDFSKYLTLEAMGIIGMSWILRKYLKPEDIKEMLDSLGCGHLLTDDMSM
jgi:hypothetical protein